MSNRVFTLLFNKKFLVFITILLGAIYFGHNYWISWEESDHLTLHGNVDIRQVDLGFRVSGKITEMSVDEGDAVKAGKVIARLDKVPYLNSVDNMRALMQQAEAEYKKRSTGNRPQDIKQAEALVKEKQASYQNAQIAADRQEAIKKKGFESQQDYDNALTQAKAAAAQLKAAEESLSELTEGFRAEEIEQARASFESAKANYNQALTNLADVELTPLEDGVVLTRVREAGSIVQAGQVVYTLSLLNPVWVRAYISEMNLGRIKSGMEALVYTDTRPDKPYKGQIGFISSQSEFTPKNIETKELRTDLVYRIRIVVEDPNGELRQGMPVTVTIKLSPK